MTNVRNLTGAIEASESADEALARREREVKEREQVKLARAKKIRSRYGAGTFDEKQALGQLSQFQLDLHGGVKLGSLEPMSVSRPGADTLTGVDFLNFPVYFVHQGAGESLTGTMDVFSRRSEYSYGRAHDRSKRSDSIPFDVELIEVTFKRVDPVDAKYLFEHSGTPPCGQRDFETLNSDSAPVSSAVRILVPSNPDKVRILFPKYWPFDRSVVFGHDVGTRLFTEVLEDGETLSAREYPHPYGTFARNSVSEIYTQDDNGDVYRRFETEYDHVMDGYTDRFSSYDYPVRLSSEIDVVTGQTSFGTDITKSFGMPSIVMPGDNMAIFEVRPDRFTRLC